MARHKARRGSDTESKRHQRAVAGHGTRCPDCGKRRFNSRKAARKAARTIKPGEQMGVYRCGDYWHFGHTPYVVARGVIDRREVR